MNGCVNERLRTTLLRAGVATEDLAACCGVDVKTVNRWISNGRVPHRRHRWAAAKRLGVDETYLWPSVLTEDSRRDHARRTELVELYPDRASVPRETWIQLLTSAREHIDVIVFSGTFYAQTQPRIARMLAGRAAVGAKVRLCFGDPTSQAVAIRDREEGIGDTLGHKIRSSLTYYRELIDVEGVEVRLHGTTLYASMFRYDDELLVNPHAYGEAGSANPVLHLRRVDGGTLFDHYTTSFQRVWDTALPWMGGEI